MAAASGSGKERPATSRWEWLAAALGAALVLASLGYMAGHALTRPQGPAAVTVELGGIAAVEGGYVARIRVANRGHTTASAIDIEGELHDADGASVERSTTTLDYLSPDSSREGGLFFTRDPVGHRLDLRATGYMRP
jgi:uncharacterized protein (TIGR02588 family)